MAVATVVAGALAVESVGTESVGTGVVGTESAGTGGVGAVPAEQFATEARSAEPPEAAAIELLALATRGLAAAAATPHPYDRYTAAQLAALRAAAGLVAQRAPATGRRRVTSVWKLLARTVPELGEWAVFFQSRSHNRVVTPGATGWVTSRDADDMLREAATFVELVAHCLGRHEDGIRALGDRLVCT
ncbi:MAG: SAV_6107 family HEPN domain-containing protein [Candidatus Nanopelagicales bacterium]